jgi:hypothetical protein
MKKSCEEKNHILDGGTVGSLQPLQKRHFAGRCRPSFFSPETTLHKIQRENYGNSLAENKQRNNLQVGLLKESPDSGVIRESGFLFTAQGAVGEGDESHCELIQDSQFQKNSVCQKRSESVRQYSTSSRVVLSRLLKLLKTIQHYGALSAIGLSLSFQIFCSNGIAQESIGTGNAVSFNSYNVEKLVSAIYLAEGGERAKKPFGILSVPCSDYSSCKKICTNTVRNNLKRWEKAGKPGDYLEFLSKKYAPVGMGKNSNDPRNLNKNWYSNVKKIYGRLQCA